MKPFYIYNTLSRSVEEFKPIKPGEVSYYSCGPTVYLPQHLGNMRAYIFVDTLRRALEFNDYRVKHVMNITDVGHMTSDEDAGEDKIEKTAREQGRTPREIADYYIAQFKRDCGLLNIKLPKDSREDPLEKWPLCRATDHIEDMIALIKRIIAHDFAYQVPSGVYFDVEKWRGANRAGRLSRQSLDEQSVVQRLEHASDKRSPHDFVLWVLEPQHIMQRHNRAAAAISSASRKVLGQPQHIQQWDSPWGRGYPGWHIECSAMSMKYLGETIDIHSGGLDHVPIHHEDEIAQSESATGKPFVRYFVHNAFLTGLDGAKLSKSAGRFPLLDDLVNEGTNPLAFRLFCLGAKYRSSLTFSEDAVRAAAKSLEYFHEFARSLPGGVARAGGADGEWATPFRERFNEAINNDLNTPQALAVALELVAEAYRREDRRIWNALLAFDGVLGLGLEEIEQRAFLGEQFPPEVNALIHERKLVREQGNFKRADEIRARLEALNYIVKDTPEGSVYMRK